MSRALGLCAALTLAGCLCDPVPLMSTDAGIDSGVADSGTTDAGATDAGMTDAGMTDAGMTDAGADAGAPDAGRCTSSTRPDAGGPWPVADAGVLFARAADLDRDGFDDLIIAVRSPEPGLFILRGAATGFASQWTGFVSTSPYISPVFTVADFSGDGCPDILSVGLQLLADGGEDADREAFDGFEGTGDLTFPLPRKRWERYEPSSPRGTLQDVTSGFFDGDNVLDFVRSRAGPGNNYGGGPQFFRLDWSTFAPFNEQTIQGNGFVWGMDQEWLGPPIGLATFSVDGGRDQLVAAAQNGVMIYAPWNASFSIGSALTSLVAPRPNVKPAIADLTGDGIPEFTLEESRATYQLVPPSARYAGRFSGVNHVAMEFARFDDAGMHLVMLRTNASSLYVSEHVLLDDGGIDGNEDTVVLSSSVDPVTMAIGRFTAAEKRIVAIDKTGQIHCAFVYAVGDLRICP